MVKKVIIITILDLVIIGLWIYSNQPDPSAAIAPILIIPVIIVINLVIGLSLLALKNNWAIPVLINIIMSSLIFNWLFDYAIEMYTANHYKSFYFENEKKNYEVILDLDKGNFKNNSIYGFYERGNGSSMTIGLDGHYRIFNDTIILSSDSGRIIKIFKNMLLDYPTNGDKIEMKRTLKRPNDGY